MNDRSIDVTELSEELRQLIRETEVTGRRTLFSRNRSPVAILVSHDEYLALKETIELASQPELLRDLELAEEQGRSGALLLPEDLLVE